jgi:methyl-accepting chemotaxis protein
MNLRRLFGFLLIVAAVPGIIFSIFGVVEVWRVKPIVTKTVGDNLVVLDQTLRTTEDGLNVVGQMVQIISTDVGSLYTTIQALAQAIHATDPVFDSLSTLSSKTLPDAIGATRSSLASAQDSALLIDNVLSVLTSLPFSPVAQYKPAVPLHTALAQVSTSLDAIPAWLATINTSLISGKANLGQVEGELAKISETVKGISDNLDNAKKVIDQYKNITIQLKTRVEAAQLAAPGWITGIAWGATFVLVWLLIAQMGLCMQGLDMLRGRRA